MFFTKKSLSWKGKLIAFLLLTELKWASFGIVNKSDDDEERLLARLFDGGYNPELRPVFNKSETVTVTLGLTIHQIFELDEKNQILRASFWVRLTWINPFLRWSPVDYGGINNVNIDAKRVWKPDIYLYNNAEDRSNGALDRFNTKIVLDANGTSRWLAPAIISSSCKIDVKYFPFDEQSCGLKFGSWTFDGHRLDIVPESSKGDIGKFVTNGEWILVSFTSQRNEIVYICCPEPYPDVTYTLKIRRLTTFYFINLIIPCLVITGLTLLSFYLPPESGERITLVITNLLALTVFMLLVAEIMPATSEVVPVVSIYYTCTIFEVALALVATCFVLKIYFKNPAMSEMPVWLRHVVLGVLSKLFRIRTNKRKQILADLNILNCRSDDSPIVNEHSALNGHYEMNGTAGAKLQTNFTGIPLENLRRVTESLALPYHANRSVTVRSISRANLVNGDCCHALRSGAVNNEPQSFLRVPKELTTSNSTISVTRDGLQSDESNVGSQEGFLDKSNLTIHEKENELYVQEILKQQTIVAQQVGRLLLVAQEQEKEKIKKDEWVLAASIIDYGFMVVFLIMLLFSTVILFTLSR